MPIQAGNPFKKNKLVAPKGASVHSHVGKGAVQRPLTPGALGDPMAAPGSYGKPAPAPMSPPSMPAVPPTDAY